MKIIALCLSGLLAGSTAALAQSDVAPLHFTLRPVISFDDPEQAVFKQCLFRELRKIPETIIVDDLSLRVGRELTIIILRLGKNSGAKIGYAASVLEFQPLDPDAVSMNRDTHLDWLLSGSGYVAHDAILADTSLVSLCQRIVADWETDSVEPMRQYNRKLYGANATAN